MNENNQNPFEEDTTEIDNTLDTAETSASAKDGIEGLVERGILLLSKPVGTLSGEKALGLAGILVALIIVLFSLIFIALPRPSKKAEEFEYIPSYLISDSDTGIDEQAATTVIGMSVR